MSDQIGDLYKAATSSLSKAEAANASGLGGEVPDDVWAQIEQKSAESAAMQGFGVGSMSGKKSARDLGLMSTQLTQQGIANATAIAGQQAQIASSKESAYNQRKQLDISQQSLDANTAYQNKQIGLQQQTLAADTAANTRQLDISQQSLDANTSYQNKQLGLQNRTLDASIVNDSRQLDIAQLTLDANTAYQNRGLAIQQQTLDDNTMINTRRTDLMFDELRENTNLKYVEYLSGLAGARGETQMRYFLGDQGGNFVDSGSAATFDSIISRVEARMKGV